MQFAIGSSEGPVRNYLMQCAKSARFHPIYVSIDMLYFRKTKSIEYIYDVDFDCRKSSMGLASKTACYVYKDHAYTSLHKHS